jgi:hypothetical protein
MPFYAKKRRRAKHQPALRGCSVPFGTPLCSNMHTLSVSVL